MLTVFLFPERILFIGFMADYLASVGKNSILKDERKEDACEVNRNTCNILIPLGNIFAEGQY